MTEPESGEERVIEKGKKVKISYTLFVDGDVVDSTEYGQEPIEYEHGKNQIIPGLERQLEGLEVGEEKEIIVGPEDGYGILDPRGFIEISRAKLPEGELHIGMQLQVTESDGQKFIVSISEIKEVTVIINFNHPLAGKELRFVVRVIEISDRDL